MVTYVIWVPKSLISSQRRTTTPSIALVSGSLQRAYRDYFIADAGARGLRGDQSVNILADAHEGKLWQQLLAATPPHTHLSLIMPWLSPLAGHADPVQRHLQSHPVWTTAVSLAPAGQLTAQVSLIAPLLGAVAFRRDAVDHGELIDNDRGLIYRLLRQLVPAIGENRPDMTPYFYRHNNTDVLPASGVITPVYEEMPSTPPALIDERSLAAPFTNRWFF